MVCTVRDGPLPSLLPLGMLGRSPAPQWGFFFGARASASAGALCVVKELAQAGDREGAIIDLKTFVTETLQEIVEGVPGHSVIPFTECVLMS